MEDGAHCGLNGDIWAAVVRESPEVLENIWKEMERKLTHYIDEDETKINLLFQCKWGKHRSVATAEITKFMIGDAAKTPEHLAKPRWGKYTCGRRWCECHDMNAKKQDVLGEARAIWRRVWG